MCIILTTPVDTPYPGVRQVLFRRDVLYEGEDTMDPPGGGYDFANVPEEDRYFLVIFMRVRQWSFACDILAEHPSLVAPWASNFLRAVMMEGHLSAADFEIFCAHIFVLDLAQTLGIARTRAFLDRLG